ncbi:MAG: tetratricopeptide repeat protein [Chlorobiales bacterium]|nr:tetratricopeptide repeat protein [Chlorobiales bacterium]
METDSQREARAHSMMSSGNWSTAGALFVDLAQNGHNPEHNFYNAGICFEYNEYGQRRGSGADLEEAKRCFQKSIASGASLEAGALLSIGLIEMTLGESENAELTLRNAKFKDPNSFQISGALGWVLNGMGKYKDAVEPLKQALNLNPNDCDALINLAIAYDNLQQPGPALATYKLFCDKAAQLSHLHPSIGSNIPIAQQAIGRLITKFPDLKTDPKSNWLDIVLMKPNLFGIGLDLNELFKRIRVGY